MYSTCLFCHHDLGSNEVIEHFPVGRRLAFDAAKGRLWAVCARCRRWNLTPVEERWEAVEECERQFRQTRLRVSTDNIGLARLPEGLELVRVGEPLRPEFAAWRYGAALGRRRVRTAIQVGAGLTALGAVVAGGAAAGVGVGGAWWVLFQLSRSIVKGNPDTVVARVPTSDVEHIEVRRDQLERLALAPGQSAGEVTLTVRHRRGTHAFVGGDAVRAAGLLLPKLNRFGGSRRDVREAVEAIERAGGPDGFFARAALLASGRMAWRTRAQRAAADGPLDMTRVERLALEMAAHEESERQALEAELKMLEAAWREAEEVAAIADDLLLPRFVDDFLRRHRPR